MFGNSTIAFQSDDRFRFRSILLPMRTILMILDIEDSSVTGVISIAHRIKTIWKNTQEASRYERITTFDK